MDALNKCILIFGIVLLVSLPGAQAIESFREWKTADGTKTLQAEYLSSRNGDVTIRRKQDGKTFTISLDVLSEEDREWVQTKEKEIAAGGPREAGEKFADLISGEWERTEGHGLKYRLYGDRKLRRTEGGGYPLVVYLHGRNMDVMTDDVPWLAKEFASDSNYRERPCFIIAPQNPDQMGWNGEKADGVIAIVRELIDELPVDEKRIYLNGYSMGAFGTFRIIEMEPKLFAAGVPVAGGGSPRMASTIKDVPFWVFHGANDPTVNVSLSRDIVDALKNEGVEVRYTEYPEGDHGIAGRVYADEEMHEWLFDQSR